jgi:hypothetical protein
VVIWVGSSSSTLRRRRRVVLRCEPRGPPPPRGGPPRLGPLAAPAPAGAPGRAPKPVPPGRDGPPVRAGPPVWGPRGLIGRGPPGPEGRDDGPPVLPGRRIPGGGGIGRPEGLMGRPGGGGIGRPVELSGGRMGVAGASPASEVLGRCVGRMVVGPSLGVTRAAVGLGAGAGRLRTTRGASLAMVGADDSALMTAVSVAGAAAGAAAGAGACNGEVASDTAGLAPRADLAFAGSSGATSRRRPSASALRRMRSAWASSIEAEGLDAPIPSVWASASNSLLVRPSSLESSCTRIFFCAKTFP